jgi:hypothetical protein
MHVKTMKEIRCWKYKRRKEFEWKKVNKLYGMKKEIWNGVEMTIASGERNVAHRNVG